ncbi:hypothetical protein C8T65DRAFT_635200 [Cerioporus squamosus]|nr:hypothetical protein C8T65DRAFT_635200 [Cerioporus squamosus]
MFIWYRDADICYTFMADVPSDEDPYREESAFSRSAFSRSRWFTRGWTLQELIAPRVLVFLSQDWTVLGTRATLSKVVERVTGVDEAILAHRQRLDEISVARRMSWAAGRETTRVEDEAYSLLGIFDINMPTLYGEGRRAFMRLQEDILKRIPDQTIFAWGKICQFSSMRKNQSIELPHDHASLFAPSPAYFKGCGRIGTVPHGVLAARLGAHLKVLPLPEYTVSAYGIRTQFPLVSLFHSCRLPPHAISESFHAWYLAILACDLPNGELLALVCFPDHSRADITLKSGRFGTAHYRAKSHRLLALSQHDTLMLPDLYIETVYIDPVHHSNLPHRSLASKPETMSPLDNATIALAGWSEAELRKQGYTVAHEVPAVFLLCNGLHHVVITVRSLPSPADPDVKCMLKCTHSVAATVDLWPPRDDDYKQTRVMFRGSDGTSLTVCVTLRWLPAMYMLLTEIRITEGGFGVVQ